MQPSFGLSLLSCLPLFSLCTNDFAQFSTNYITLQSIIIENLEYKTFSLVLTGTITSLKGIPNGKTVTTHPH